MQSIPTFTPTALDILNGGGGGGGGGTVTNPIANELVVFASNVTSPFALESATTTATLHQPLSVTGTIASTGAITTTSTIGATGAITTASTITATGAITSSSTLNGTGVTLATAATNPGGASTIWWTTPSTRPNFGTNGPLALLSDASGSVGVTSTTVNLSAPASSPFATVSSAAQMILTKLTIGTTILVFGIFNNLNGTTPTTVATAPIDYAAGTVPAGYIPAIDQVVPVTLDQQAVGNAFTSYAEFGTDGSLTIVPAKYYTGTAAATIPWNATGLAAAAGVIPGPFVYIVASS